VSGRRSLRLLALATLMLGVAIAAVLGGSVTLRLADVIAALGSADGEAALIVRELRLPRVLLSLSVGAALAVAGCAYQALFRNPLADPYLLGSASGSSLGVALALMLYGASPLASQWLVRLGLTGAAFVGAVLAVLLTLLLAKGALHTLKLLLAGVVVGVVLGALVSLTMQVSPEVMQAMQAFMLGSTGFVGWTACVLMALVWGVCMLAAWMLSPVLDGLTLGEVTATSLGLPLPRLRAALIVVLALATGTAVAQTGLIAFVGLAAPHLVRSVAKTRHGSLILLSSLMGGVLLMAADILARWLIAPQELPVGVLTAVLGGGYLLWLMHRGPTMPSRGSV
jgi:iron complex transport system permease protein